jgi:hypothetical protein
MKIQEKATMYRSNLDLQAVEAISILDFSEGKFLASGRIL